MPHMTGNIEAISIKEMPQPDNYGNVFRASLKIGEDWVSYGTLKKDAINVKVGSDWMQVAKGMEVEFMYKQNGDFKNIDKKSFSITDASSAQAPQAPRASTPQAPQQAGKNFVNPATVGACLNLAIEVLGYKKADFDDEKKLIEAIRWHKSTFDKLLELYPTVEAVAPKKVAPKAKEEDAPFEYDDELDI